MAMKVTGDDGVEVEVYTAAEVQAKTAEAVQAKEKEFGTVKSELEGKLTETQKALGERAGEFTRFRKLNDDAVTKLSIAERTIYENGLALQKANEDRLASEASVKKERIETVIKAKAGGNEKLADKMRSMWEIVGLQAETPEQIEAKAKTVLGAIGATEPDMVSVALGFGGGSHMPARPAGSSSDDKSFSDTDKGKQGASELGLTLEAPKK